MCSSTSARGPRSTICCMRSSAARRRMGASRSVRRSRSRSRPCLFFFFGVFCVGLRPRDARACPSPYLPCHVPFAFSFAFAASLPFLALALPFARLPLACLPLASLLRLRHSAPLLLAPRVSIFPLISLLSSLVSKMFFLFVSTSEWNRNRNRNRNRLHFRAALPCPVLSCPVLSCPVVRPRRRPRSRPCVYVRVRGDVGTSASASGHLHTTLPGRSLGADVGSARRHDTTGSRTGADIDIPSPFPSTSITAALTPTHALTRPPVRPVRLARHATRR